MPLTESSHWQNTCLNLQCIFVQAFHKHYCFQHRSIIWMGHFAEEVFFFEQEVEEEDNSFCQMYLLNANAELQILYW